MFVSLLLFLTTQFVPQAPQYHVQLAVRDSYSGNWIAGASVTEVGTGVTVMTDSDGRAQLAGAHSPEGKITLSISAPGYPLHFKEIWIPDYTANASIGFSPVWGITVGLTPEFVFLTPPVGPKGGAFTFMRQTGQQMIADSVATDFFQRVRLVVPPDVFAQKYRVGISLIPNHSFNNAFLESSSLRVELLAQFRIGLLDLQGSRVLALPDSLPIRIEVAPASCDEKLSHTQKVGFWRFDPQSEKWTKDGISSEGLLFKDNSGFVEVGKLSEYAMVVQDSGTPGDHWLLSMTTQPDFASSLSRMSVNCGYSGASISVGVDTTTSFTLERPSGTSLDSRAKRRLLGLGYAVSGSSVHGGIESSTYSKVVHTWVSIAHGKNVAYFEQTGVNSKGEAVGRGKSGRVHLRNLTTTFLWTKEGGDGLEEYSTTSTTGIVVDTSQLGHESYCPDGVKLE